MNNDIAFWVSQETWDKVKGKTRLAVRRILHESFNMYGQKNDLPIVEDALMDIFDAGVDVLRGADKPILARNWRALIKGD